MPSVTWPGASSRVWYQPISLARSRACTAHTLEVLALAGDGFEDVFNRLVVGGFGEVRRGRQAGLAQPRAQRLVVRQPPHGFRQRGGRLARLVDQAVLLVVEVFAGAAGPSCDH